jgi:hypothetical protein
VIQHPPYSLDITPADFFLFPRVKRELKEWEEATRTLSVANFATLFSRWYERCKKCIDIARTALKKLKINIPPPTTVLFFIEVFQDSCKHTLYIQVLVLVHSKYKFTLKLLKQLHLEQEVELG